MTFSAKAPLRSPDPNRRRCRQCQHVSTGLVVVEHRKLSGSLWYWYHLGCVSDDDLPSVYVSDERIVAWQANMWGKVHMSRVCAGRMPARKVITVEQANEAEAGVCRRCALHMPPASHYPFKLVEV